MSGDTSDHSASSLIAVASVFLGISVITVILRFYARRRQKTRLLADDWLTLPGLAAFAGACGALWFAVDIKSLGYSTGDFSKEYVQAMAERYTRSQLGLNVLSVICLSCTKASALFFYKRIFCVSSRKAILNILIIASVIIQALWMVTFCFLIAFQCHTHFDAPWTGQQLKYCTLSYPVLESQAISDFLLDLWVLILPIYPIWKLHTTKSRKFAIIGIFFLACLGFGSSIARMVIMIRQVNLGIEAVHKVNPQEHQSRMMFYWTVEMGVSVICINLPSIWMVFASVAPEAILRSVRSVVSLASIGSRGSGRSKASRDPSNLERLKSSTSTSSIAPISGASVVVEAYELGDAGRHGTVPTGQIHVSRSVEQTSGSRGYDGV